jgi:thioredoxin 2
MGDRLAVCSRCGGVNRLPEGRPAKAARCGKCGAALFAGHPEDVPAAIFETQLGRSSLPVLVDFWAPWCGPCLMMAPAFEEAARELEPDVRLIKLNSDEAPEQSARFGIRSIPTMILFRGGREIARTSGAMGAGQITRWVRQHLGPDGRTV